MAFQFHTYVMSYSSAKLTKTGKKRKPKPLRASLASDNEATNWVKLVIERDGGSARLTLQDRTLFIWPSP